MELTPYIIFDGNCEEALNFYAKALGGQINNLTRYKDAPPTGQVVVDTNKVMHAHLAVNGNAILMASDSGQGGPASPPGGMVHLSLNLKDPGQIQNVFARMSEGARINMPLQDTFWGATFGMITDRFGVNWMFNYDKPTQ